MELRNRVVLVTGASSGIGRATARMVAARGAKVVLAARRAQRLAELCQELSQAIAVPTDLRQSGEPERLVRTALEQFGRIDVLVNNAGQGLHVPVAEIRLEDLIAITELNVYAPLLLMQAVRPAMLRQGGGVIVNVSSGTSRTALPGVGAYAATKSMLNKLSEIARAEWAHDGIVVSLVQPFVTDTEFHDVLRAGRMPERSHRTVRADPPETVAEAIVHLIETGEAEIDLRPGRSQG